MDKNKNVFIVDKHISFAEGNLIFENGKYKIASPLQNEENMKNALFTFDVVCKNKWKENDELKNYRMLSLEEWKDIFQKYRYVNARIEDDNTTTISQGIILIPDIDDEEINAFFNRIGNKLHSSNIDIKTWEMLESKGCVFLYSSQEPEGCGYWISVNEKESLRDGLQIGTYKSPLYMVPSESDKLFVRLVYDID